MVEGISFQFPESGNSFKIRIGDNNSTFEKQGMNTVRLEYFPQGFSMFNNFKLFRAGR